MNISWQKAKEDKGEWDKYFDYWELKADNGIYHERSPKSGYEYLADNHGELESIKKVIEQNGN